CWSAGLCPKGHRAIPKSSAWRCMWRTTRSSTAASKATSPRASTAPAMSISGTAAPGSPPAIRRGASRAVICALNWKVGGCRAAGCCCGSAKRKTSGCCASSTTRILCRATMPRRVRRPPPAARASAKAARQSGAKTRPPGRAAAMPRDLAPQLATLVDRPPSGSGWSYEMKYDGYRIMCALQGRTARLASRNANDWTTRMKPLAEALGRLELGAGWLDGEVVCLNERGISHFQALQNALDGDGQGLRFVAFDLPYWNGRDLRRLPLAERQAMLEALLAELPEDAPLLLTQRLEVADDTEGAAAWTEACRLSLEGLICKRLDSAYVAGR